uniref:Uncharacterized protein n=1 Tax=Arundo donax TaxID=35708 RepID=A0A0A9CXA0_ARUDO
MHDVAAPLVYMPCLLAHRVKLSLRRLLSSFTFHARGV